MHKRLLVPAVITILILAAALRIWGLGWGLPTSLHYFSYHPDETTVLYAALNVNFFAGELNPGFYNYGSLFVYLVNFAIVGSTVAGAINLPDDVFSNIGEFAKLYYAGRLVAVVLGILTVWAVYVLARKAYGRKAGLIAALLMAVLPIHVMHSKFMAVDVPATFLVTLALVFALRISEKQRARDYIFAGLIAGLAAGTKYNAGLVIAAPIIVHFTVCQASVLKRIFSPKLLGMILCAAVGFLIGTPGAVLYTGDFARDFRYEVWHVLTGHGLVFTGTGSGFVYHITHSLCAGMGLPLLALSLIGLLYALRRRTTADIAMLVFLAAYYTVIGLAQVRFARYTIPILPVLVIFAARLSSDTLARLFSGRSISRVVGYLAVVVLVTVTTYTAGYSVAIDRSFVVTDTRDQAVAWVFSAIPQGASIGMPTIPYFYTPPLDPYFGLVKSEDRYDRVCALPDYDLVVSPATEWDSEFLQREAPKYVILSEFEYEDRVRVHDPAAAAYLGVLGRDYHLAKEFSHSLSLFGRSISLLPELPHDMSYVSPTIKIFERKD